MSRLFAILTAVLLLAGCSGIGATPAGGGAAAARVTGTVTCLERVALPSTAVLKVALVDVSRADAPAIVLGEQVIHAANKQAPFAFAIPYDPARIEPRNTYAVQARVEDDGKLLCINDRHYGVITRGEPRHVDMALKAIGRL